MPDQHKRCTRCEQDKPLDAYRRGQGYKNGIRAECKACEAERLKRWRTANPERVKKQTARRTVKQRLNGTGYFSGDPLVALQRRNSYLKRKYGITLEDEQRMREAQGGRCATCDELAILHVDHCHITGKVRGLLCDNCNRAAGAVEDDPARLRALAEYMERGGVEVAT